MLTPCVFFDRDGVANRPPTLDRYVRNWGEFVPIPAFFDALRVVAAHGYAAVIVTNQRGIATGHMSQADVDQIHDNLMAMVHAHGLQLKEIIVCPHPDDTHPCRKPNPGMLLDAARRHQLDLPRSWMVGDSETDVLAGRRAGCHTILVKAGQPATVADYRLENMEAVPAFLDQHLPPPG